MNEDEHDLEQETITDRLGVDTIIFQLYHDAVWLLATEPRRAHNAINVVVNVLHPYQDDYFRGRLEYLRKQNLTKYKFNYYRLRAISDLLDRIGLGLMRGQSTESFAEWLKKEMIAWAKSET